MLFVLLQLITQLSKVKYMIFGLKLTLFRPWNRTLMEWVVIAGITRGKSFALQLLF